MCGKRQLFSYKRKLQDNAFVTSINFVPSYSIFSFTTNLLAFKSNFGWVFENFSPRNVLLNLFVLHLSSFGPYILTLHCDMNVHKLETSLVYSNRSVNIFCC